MTTIRPNVNTAPTSVRKKEDEDAKTRQDLIDKQNKENQQANNNRYAVVDDFKTKDVDIDGDGTADMSHGDYITTLMKAQNPNIQIDSYDVSNDVDGSKKISAYDQIAINNYAAVNMSISKPYSADVFNKDGVKDVNQSNFDDRKNEIYNTYKNGDPEYNKLFNSMEKVTANGTPIFVSAGNEGSDTYNLYSTVPGVTSVGASASSEDAVNLQSSNYRIGPKGMTQEGDQILGYSAMNSGVDLYGKGSFKSEAVEDKNGNVMGYDINGDGKVDIANDKVSGGGKFKPQNHYIFGTSFASPTTMLDQTNPFGQPIKDPVVILSDKEKQEAAGVDQHGVPISTTKVKNKDLEDGIEIDDNIEDWDTL